MEHLCTFTLGEITLNLTQFTEIVNQLQYLDWFCTLAKQYRDHINVSIDSSIVALSYFLPLDIPALDQIHE